MTKLIFSIIAILTCSICLALEPTSAFSDCTSELFSPCEKTYVKIQNVSFLEDGIYIVVDDAIIKTSAIYLDEQGYFFKNFKQGKCEYGYWECSVCHHCNPNYKIWCEDCGN